MDQRQQNLHNRRIQRLRSELCDHFGTQRIDLIDLKIEEHMELFSQGKMYTEVLNIIIDDLENATSAIPKVQKRGIPDHPRQKVADEWAALTLQQDEVQHQVDQNLKKLEAEKQASYRRELERQLQENGSEINNLTSQAKLEEFNYMQKLQQQDNAMMGKQKELDQKRQEQRRQFDEVNLKNKLIRDQTKQQNEHSQAAEFQKFLSEHTQKEKEEENRARLQTIRRRREVNEANAKILDDQRKRRLREAETERRLPKTSLETSDAHEQLRQKHLNDYDQYLQKVNQLYPQNTNQLRLQDESRIRDYISAKQAEFDKKISAEKLKRQNDHEEMVKMLNDQVREKNNRLINDHRNDIQYANSLLADSQAAKSTEQIQLERMRRNQRVYSMDLQKQMKDQQSNRAQMFAMNDAEKRFNQRDLDAYTKQAPVLDSMLPGLDRRPDAVNSGNRSFNRRKPKAYEFEAPLSKRQVVRSIQETETNSSGPSGGLRSKSTTPFKTFRNSLVNKSVEIPERSRNPSFQSSVFGHAGGRIIN